MFILLLRSLCPHARSSIPPLVRLLQDTDKTRTNAAGALGNFIRNSDIVMKEVMEAKAIEGLLKLVSVDIQSSCFA